MEEEVVYLIVYFLVDENYKFMWLYVGGEVYYNIKSKYIYWVSKKFEIICFI